MRNFEVRYPVQGANALDPRFEETGRRGVIIPFPGNESSFSRQSEEAKKDSFNRATPAQSAAAFAIFTAIATLAVLFL